MRFVGGSSADIGTAGKAMIMSNQQARGESSWRDHALEDEAWEREHAAEWVRVDRKLRGIAARRAALDAEEANLLRYAEELKLWRGWGFASMLEYVERAMGYAPRTAVERLRVARAIAELPYGARAERGGSPAYKIAIKQCPDCKRAWQFSGGRDIEIRPEVAECAACDAVHLGSLDAATPDRATTTVTPRKREQVLARDGYRCTVPGCRRNVGLDLHHIGYQSHGGGHEMSNLLAICSLHHKAVHFGKLVIRGAAPDGVTFELREPRDRWNVTDDEVSGSGLAFGLGGGEPRPSSIEPAEHQVGSGSSAVAPTWGVTRKCETERRRKMKH
ncbi:MAG TPA: hypothetical protein VK932_24400 [Kofleriaceae bacterium]|nr:hypothetical protein [Kofleriaceae bacterium]